MNQSTSDIISKGSVTVLMPSVRGDGLVMGALFSAFNQTEPPIRGIMLDASIPGIKHSEAFSDLARFLPVEVYRRDQMHPYDARNWLAEQARTEWLWFVDDDLLVEHDCLENLMQTALRYDVGMVGGVKIDVTVVVPWKTKNFVLQNHPRHHRDIQMPWCDTCNCLVRREAWLDSCRNFTFQTNDSGEDICVTAVVADKVGCMGCGEAIGLHLPPDGKESVWDEQHIVKATEIHTFDMFKQIENRISGRSFQWLKDCLGCRIQPGELYADFGKSKR